MTKMAKISQNQKNIYDRNNWKPLIPFGAAQTQIGHITEYRPRKDFFAKEVLLKEYIIIMSHHYKPG